MSETMTGVVNFSAQPHSVELSEVLVPEIGAPHPGPLPVGRARETA